MQQHFEGIQRPLSSRPASVAVTICLDPDGNIHHLEFEVRSIAGNLLAASAAPGCMAPTPNAVLAWCASHLIPLLEDEVPWTPPAAKTQTGRL